MKITITLNLNDFSSIDKRLIPEAIDTGLVSFISQSYAGAALKLFSKDEKRAELFGNIADAFLAIESSLTIDNQKVLVELELNQLPDDVESFIAEGLLEFIIEYHHNIAEVLTEKKAYFGTDKLASFHKTWSDILKTAEVSFHSDMSLELQ